MGDDDRTTQDNLIVMDERYIREFKRDYHRDGKYKLEDQVYHLARLAEHYERRYEITQQWTDCLKVRLLVCFRIRLCSIHKAKFCAAK